jgi:drug/metabolite transporter (DMT)-like permease
MPRRSMDGPRRQAATASAAPSAADYRRRRGFPRARRDRKPRAGGSLQSRLAQEFTTFAANSAFTRRLTAPTLFSSAPTVRGMLWMAAAGVLFIVLNTMMKRLAHQLDPWMVGLLRYATGALVILGPTLRRGARALWPRAPRLQLLRGLFHAGGMMLWFAALPSVSLPELTAISFSGPVFICLGAVLFLGERMTGARWAAVLVGFGGVLLVLKPGTGSGFAGISPGMLMMLGTAPVFAGSYLVAKALAGRDRSEVIVLWQHLWVVMLLAPFALPHWAPPDALQWLLLVACGLFGAGGHYCMMRAFRVTDISAVQSVRFLELVWAAILGYLVFGSAPAGATVLGGAVILASTLLLARHESRASNAARISPSETAT